MFIVGSGGPVVVVVSRLVVAGSGFLCVGYKDS